MRVTSDEIVVQVDSLTSGLSKSSTDLYLAVGLPKGYTELDSGIKFEPKLLSLSASSGSAAGSLITAVVKGVGINDQVTLWDDVNSRDLCKTAKVTAYGQLECLTYVEEISPAT